MTTSLWAGIAKAIDAIQDKAIQAKSVEELITLLLEMEDLPIPREQTAIVYQNYGATRPEFWAIGNTIRQRNVDEDDFGRTIDFGEEPTTDFPADHPLITAVIASGERQNLQTTEACGTCQPVLSQSFTN